MYTVSLCVFSLTVTFFLQTANADCGVASIQPTLPQAARRRIVGGNTAVANSWPWAIAMNYNGYFRCGGSLIPNGDSTQSDLILTAAHCVLQSDGVTQLNPSDIKIILGAHDITDPDEETQIVRNVSALQQHDSYNASQHTYDVALMRLSSPVSFSQYVQPICLPTADQDPADANQCYAVGWGRTSNSDSATSSTLQQALLPVLSDSTCSDDENWGTKYNQFLMLCAGYLSGTKSTCNGDSGGPFVCKDGDHYTSFGVVSFGMGALVKGGLAQCAYANRPPVFAKTSAYVDWISETASTL